MISSHTVACAATFGAKIEPYICKRENVNSRRVVCVIYTTMCRKAIKKAFRKGNALPPPPEISI